MAPNLKPIDEADWLIPDTEAGSWLNKKRELMVRQRADVFAVRPGSEAAASEASRFVFAHLGQENAFQMPTELENASAQVSDDLCIMENKDEGEWRLTVASLCAPTYWRLSEKIGLPLGGLHSPVPDGDPELAARIGRVFSAMRADQIMERCNWTIQAGAQRYTPASGPLKLAAAVMKPENAARELHMRVERQTIRKLPETCAVLFTIRICIDPLKGVLAVQGAREALAHAWAAAHPAVARYKGWAVYDRLMEHVLQ